MENLSDKTPECERTHASEGSQKIDEDTLDKWLSRYKQEVLNVVLPGQPLIRNEFMKIEEGYKDECWDAWQQTLRFKAWNQSMIGSKSICRALQQTLDDTEAIWISRRNGGFKLEEKLIGRQQGIERFERAAYEFYTGDMMPRDFFDEAVALLGQQYSVISHLMFLKDKTTYVPVAPDVFETGLRKLGVEFYLSGCCSWGSYTKFLGLLGCLHEKLLEIEPDATLLDAHSILWIIGSGYWFEGEGAELLARIRSGEKTAKVYHPYQWYRSSNRGTCSDVFGGQKMH